MSPSNSSTAPPVTGSYQAGELNSRLNADFNVVPGGPFNTGDSSTALDTISIIRGTLSGTTVGGGSMVKNITCNSASGSCSNTEALSSSPVSGTFSAGISVSNSGVVTVTPSIGTPLSGAASSDGNLFVLASGHPSPDGDAGIVLGLKAGTGMTNASLSGTYNFASVEFGLGSNSSSVTSESGTITLDGGGNLSGNLLQVQTRVSSFCGSSSLCPTQSVSTSSKSETPTAGYSVTPSGVVTITGPGDTISGYASQDGKIIVLTSSFDGSIGTSGGSDSNRGLFVLIRR